MALKTDNATAQRTQGVNNNKTNTAQTKKDNNDLLTNALGLLLNGKDKDKEKTNQQTQAEQARKQQLQAAKDNADQQLKKLENEKKLLESPNLAKKIEFKEGSSIVASTNSKELERYKDGKYRDDDRKIQSIKDQSNAIGKQLEGLQQAEQKDTKGTGNEDQNNNMLLQFAQLLLGNKDNKDNKDTTDTKNTKNDNTKTGKQLNLTA